MVKSENILYWTRIATVIGELYIAATDKGLVFVGSQDGSFSEMEKWADRQFPNVEWLESGEKLREEAKEITEYLQGDREIFHFPVDLEGTDFQKRVWEQLKEIPYGQVQTYSDIALALDNPKAVRAVGSAIGQNPMLIVIPCHRVIGKNGKLTGYRGGMKMKEHLLSLERQGV